MADTRRALERAGYREVEVTVHSGGGIDVVRVDASGPEPDRAVGLVWATLPVRFDQLVVTLGADGSSYSYVTLADRFGPRNPALNRRQVTDEVVREGLDLMILLTSGALLSVGAVVALVVLVMRPRRRRERDARGGDQPEGSISGLGDDSAAAGEPAEAAGSEAMPS